jgi:hypothetical protein
VDGVQAMTNMLHSEMDQTPAVRRCLTFTPSFTPSLLHFLFLCLLLALALVCPTLPSSRLNHPPTIKSRLDSTSNISHSHCHSHSGIFLPSFLLSRLTHLIHKIPVRFPISHVPQSILLHSLASPLRLRLKGGTSRCDGQKRSLGVAHLATARRRVI